MTRRRVLKLSEQIGEPDWARLRRLEALELHESHPMPGRSDEEWRYADAGEFGLNLDLPSTSGSHAGVAPSPLDGQAASSGAILCDLSTAQREHPQLVRTHLGSTVPARDGKIASQNAALWSSGTFLYVPGGVHVTLPLRSVRQAPGNGVGAFSRSLIVVCAKASVTLIEEHRSGRASGEGTFSNAVAEMVVEEGGSLRYINVQGWGRGVVHLSTQRARVQSGGEFQSVNVATGGKLTKAWVEVALVGTGARSDLLGIVSGNGAQRFDFTTLQDHAAPGTKSDLQYRMALAGSTRTTYGGMIRVRKEAQKSDAYQQNRNLVLSPQARANSVPKLEIHANDVRCTHGATVGSIDEEQRFYLMSRGLSPGDAELMILDGFFEPVLQRIPLADLRTRLGRAIRSKVTDGKDRG